MRSRRLVDLSHPVVSGEPGYPGLPAPRIEPFISHRASRASYDGRASFELSRLFLVGSTGTYLDSPAHRHPGGADVADLPLGVIADLPAIVVDAHPATGSRAIDLPITHGVEGGALLIRTGWDARRGTAAYWHPAPFVTGSLADALVRARVALVGIDTWNIDDVEDPARPVHTRLLAAGIPIVEQLRGLAALPPTGARFFAVPAPIRGATSMPVRAFADISPDADGLAVGAPDPGDGRRPVRRADRGSSGTSVGRPAARSGRARRSDAAS